MLTRAASLSSLALLGVVVAACGSEGERRPADASASGAGTGSDGQTEASPGGAAGALGAGGVGGATCLPFAAACDGVTPCCSGATCSAGCECDVDPACGPVGASCGGPCAECCANALCVQGVCATP